MTAAQTVSAELISFSSESGKRGEVGWSIQIALLFCPIAITQPTVNKNK